MPSVMAVQSSIADDETDDDVNLDLHISDNDDIEENGTGKSPEDIPMEIEDEILNKFDVENKSETTKEEVLLTNGDDAEGGDVDKEHRDDKTDAEETKESDAVAVNGDATKADDKEKEEEEEMKEESVEKETPTKEEEIKENNKEEITEINIKEIKEKIREEIKKHNDEEKIEEKNEDGEIEKHFEQEEIEEINEEEKLKENTEEGIKENNAEEKIEKTDEKDGEEEEAKTKPKDDKDNELTDDDMDLEESEVSTAAENKNEAEAIKLEDASKEKDLKVEQKCEEKKDVKFIENGIKEDEVKDTTKKEHDESIKNKIELVKVEEVRKSEVATEERDKEENDAEDLLLVMDEKTADAENDATKDDDDASNEDSPSDDNLGDNRIEEPMELEDKIDIEEHPADLEMTSEDASMTIEKSINIDEDEDDDVDANKENVDASDGDSSDSRKSVLESILTSPMLKNKKNLDMVTSSKSSKRLLSDSDQGDESGKKMKLSNEHESDAVIEAEPVPPKELKKLCSFKKFMQDKGLTALTRDQLEELVVQKMCECIMQKSEIGDLKLKIKAHEQMLDLLRKEVVLLSKQTRDLNIVHNKVIQNVTKIQESSDKPLVVPKITRSVGLQAIVREDVRRRFSTQHVTPAKTPAKVTAAPAAAATPIVVVAKTPQKVPVVPHGIERSTHREPHTQTDNMTQNMTAAPLHAGDGEGIEKSTHRARRQLLKQLRSSGLACISRDGKPIPAKQVPEQLCQCPQKCDERVPKELRERLFSHFYGLGDVDKQNAFLRHHIDVQALHLLDTDNTSSPRRIKCKYLVPLLPDSGVVDICQKAFISAFVITMKRVRLQREKQIRSMRININNNNKLNLPHSESEQEEDDSPSASPRPLDVKNIAAKPLTNLQVKTTPVAAKQTKATMQQQPANAKASTGVIDLTDEDDKKTTTTTAAVTATATNVAKNVTNKVNMINAPNGQKYVVMQNGQAVMVKLAPTNIVVSQPIRTIQPANGIVRTAAGNQAVRTTASAARTPARNRQPTNIVPTVRAKAPTATVTAIQPKYRHPAPLPNAPPIRDDLYSGKPLPPRPQLLLNKTTCGTGIILSWKMPYNLELFEEIASYQLYAYQETKSEPRTDSWGKIGDVKALELPMAVTLTQFAVGNRYYFAVRAVDILSRHGQFSEYQTILL